MKVICILVAILSVASSAYIGTSGWKEYYVSSFRTQASQAAQSCKSSGMVIASPSTQTEYDDLVRFFSSSSSQHNGQAYIGLSKIGDHWSNSDAQVVHFSITWFPGNPSGDGSCAEILRDNFDVGLNDLSCDHERHFICEKNASSSSVPVTSAPSTSPSTTRSSVTNSFTYIGTSGGKEYYVSSIATQAFQAAQSCQNSEMIMASPSTQTEYNDLARFFDSTSSQHSRQAFIGLSKTGDQWSNSVTGQGAHFSIKWSPGNPSGDGSCAEILCDLGINDLSCDHNRPFICEKNAFSPSTAAPVTSPTTTQSPVSESSKYKIDLRVASDNNVDN